MRKIPQKPSRVEPLIAVTPVPMPGPIAELKAPVATLDHALRPNNLADFTGQQKTMEKLEVLVSAARTRKEPLRHLIFSGPPGLGKTSLAYVLGKEMNAEVKITAGPVLERGADLAALLVGLKENQILFIDEIHRIPKQIEEYLYSAMEDFRMDILVQNGAGTTTISLPIPKFTLIGATTRAGMLSAPLLNRFSVHCRLDHYSVEELSTIILRSAKLLDITLSPSAATLIARHARGTPRIANNILRFLRDYMTHHKLTSADDATAQRAFKMLGIHDLGLEEVDIRIIRTMVEYYNNRAVGMETLAMAISESAETIEQIYEPYLVQSGIIERTPQGRKLTERGLEIASGFCKTPNPAQIEFNLDKK